MLYDCVLFDMSIQDEKDLHEAAWNNNLDEMKRLSANGVNSTGYIDFVSNPLTYYSSDM